MEPLPEDGLSDTLAHIEIPLRLTPAAVHAIAHNATLAYGFRSAIAASSSDAASGYEGDPHYAIIMSAYAADVDQHLEFSDLYEVNSYDPMTTTDEGNTARLLKAASAAFAAQHGGSRRRALQPAADEPSVYVWYVYGGSFAYVAGAKGVDADALAKRMADGLSAGQDAWTAATTDVTDDGLLGDMDGAALASSVAVDGVTATWPRLRYMPFGSFESSDVGSFIGIAVFILGVVFIGVPGMVDKAKERMGWRKLPPPSSGAAVTAV